MLEIFDTELSSWIRKRIQKIELDSQEVSLEELFKTWVTRGKVGGCIKSTAPFKDQKSGTYGYFYTTLKGVNGEIPQGILLS